MAMALCLQEQHEIPWVWEQNPTWIRRNGLAFTHLLAEADINRASLNHKCALWYLVCSSDRHLMSIFSRKFLKYLSFSQVNVSLSPPTSQKRVVVIDDGPQSRPVHCGILSCIL